MKYYTEPAKQVPIMEADVFVAGAGTAGCIAAIAAAREGAKVILVEKLPVPCGNMGNGGNVFFSYYNAEYDVKKAKRIVGGLPYEFAQRLIDEDASLAFVPSTNNTHASAFNITPNREGIKAVLCMMLQEAGVKVLLQTSLCGVVMDGQNIKYALIENKNGRKAIEAKQFIDCTGDGDIAKFCGLEQLENWSTYDRYCGGPNSLNFALNGIDFDKACREAPEVFQLVGESRDESGKWMSAIYRLSHNNDPVRCKELVDLNLRYFTTIYSEKPGEATFINNSKGVMTDASDAENLTNAEMEMRIRMFRMAKAMKHCLPGFENSHLIWGGLQLGIRTSKITVCDIMLTEADVANATRYDDEIGLYGFQDMVEKCPESKVKEPGYYGFPYRMILPKGCNNLYMAGRCVTYDGMAHMSTRNTVGCMIMGQAAGIAAAACAEKNCKSRELPYAEYREKLIRQGVILDID